MTALSGGPAGPDWLWQQSGRIADALNAGNLALAQIYGLHIPVGDVGTAALRRIVLKAAFNPDEPRLPAGNPGAANGPTAPVAATCNLVLVRKAANPGWPC